MLLLIIGNINQPTGVTDRRARRPSSRERFWLRNALGNDRNNDNIIDVMLHLYLTTSSLSSTRPLTVSFHKIQPNPLLIFISSFVTVFSGGCFLVIRLVAMIHDGSLQDRFIRIADHLASLIREHIVEPMGKLSNELFEKIHMREALVSREDLAQSRALLSRMLKDYARSGQLEVPASTGGTTPPSNTTTESTITATKPAGVGTGTGMISKSADHTATSSSSQALSSTTTTDSPGSTATGGSGSGSVVNKSTSSSSNVNGTTISSPSPPSSSPSPPSSSPSSPSSLSSSVAGLGSAIGSSSYGALTSSINSVYDGVKVIPLDPNTV